MNPLPPLPLVDGAFLIDNSSLEHFQLCRRLYELSDIRRYRLVVPAAGRNFGSCLHVGWKERYSLCGNNAPTDAQVAVINDAMSNYMTAHLHNPQTLAAHVRAVASVKEEKRREPKVDPNKYA